MFTSSNHSPFDYPDGVITPYNSPKQTRENAAKYSDYELGQFIKKAKASDYWDNWKFELTFSELQLNESSALRLKLVYREVDLDVDLAPFMRETIAQDTNAADVSGLFSFDIQQGFTNFLLNGIQWDPDFSAESGNSFSQESDGADPHFELSLVSEGTEARSLIVFTFVRVTSYGVPEP